MVRPTQELVIPIVFIDMELHPGHTVLAQQSAVATTAIGAGMLAIVDLKKGLCGGAGDAIVKGRGVLTHGCSAVILAGEDQGGGVDLVKTVAASIPRCQRNSRTQAPAGGKPERTPTTHRPPHSAHPGAINHSKNGARGRIASRNYIVQRALKLR